MVANLGLVFGFWAWLVGGCCTVGDLVGWFNLEMMIWLDPFSDDFWVWWLINGELVVFHFFYLIGDGFGGD